MKEFALPEDLSEIPLQGYRGSYAVLDLQINGRGQSEDRDVKVDNKESEAGSCRLDLFAVKVIHGQEKNTFSRIYIPDIGSEAHNKDEMAASPAYIDRVDIVRDYEQFISDLDHFIGHLPVVGYDLMGEKEVVLQNSYGMVLGKTFSNHLIDTLQMAKNHLPVAEDYSLNGLADQLGIEIQCQEPGEERCRIIWELYRRMERSELEKKPSSAWPITPS